MRHGLGVACDSGQWTIPQFTDEGLGCNFDSSKRLVSRQVEIQSRRACKTFDQSLGVFGWGGSHHRYRPHPTAMFPMCLDKRTPGVVFRARRGPCARTELLQRGRSSPPQCRPHNNKPSALLTRKERKRERVSGHPLGCPEENPDNLGAGGLPDVEIVQ